MAILLELFYVFFSIGLFCFGGGYVIIPLIQEEIVSRNWISVESFIDIIAVSESTPGPISVNTATFVGYKLEGILGAAVATFGLCLPAFIIVVFVSRLLATEKGNVFLKRIMVGIRPIVVALIFVAACTIAHTVFFAMGNANLDYKTIIWAILAIMAFLSSWRFKWHPIIMIGIGALVGVVL